MTLFTNNGIKHVYICAVMRYDSRTKGIYVILSVN